MMSLNHTFTALTPINPEIFILEYACAIKGKKKYLIAQVISKPHSLGTKNKFWPPAEIPEHANPGGYFCFIAKQCVICMFCFVQAQFHCIYFSSFDRSKSFHYQNMKLGSISNFPAYYVLALRTRSVLPASNCYQFLL